MSRYDWSKAPEWARFGTTDANGAIFWHQARPIREKYAWFSYSGASMAMEYEGWEESCEQRPTNNSLYRGPCELKLSGYIQECSADEREEEHRVA